MRRPRFDDAPVGRPRRDPATYEPLEENLTLERAKGVGEWVGIIAAAVVGALVVKALLIQAFFIPSGSMEPTLKVHDRVLVSKLSYRMGTVHRGDIVVFKRPPLEEDTSITDLIKRVIALPGETVEAHNGIVYINGNALDESYLPGATITDELPRTTVPDGQLWVMGDNRGNSADSRVFGPISEDLLVGKAFLRVWPPGAVGTL